MRVYSENDGVEFEVRFTALPNTPTVPLSVHWRLWCATTDTVRQDWTEVDYEVLADESGITGVRTVVEVDGALNDILDRSNRREIKQFQVVAAKDTPRQRTEIREYAVVQRGGA